MNFSTDVLLDAADPDRMVEVIAKARATVSRDPDSVEKYLRMKFDLNAARASREADVSVRLGLLDRNAQILILLRELVATPLTQSPLNV